MHNTFSIFHKTFFIKHLRRNFCYLNFHFGLKVCFKIDNSFTFIWKKILCHIFLFLCRILLFGSSGQNCKVIRREDGFLINSKISFMSSGDNPISILKILVANFFRFRHFTDFDIKIVLLG